MATPFIYYQGNHLRHVHKVHNLIISNPPTLTRLSEDYFTV